MPRRKVRKSTVPTQNLDSFLDILTNTVGVLMFISLFIALISVQASTLIRTPLASKTFKKPQFFEVTGNKVIYVDDASIDRQLAILMTSLPICERPNIPQNIDVYFYQIYLEQVQEYETCTNQTLEKLKKFKVETKNYTVRFVDLDAIMYEPRTSNTGESIKEISQVNSEYQMVLNKLNTQSEYLAFIVRQDSFSAFRAARQLAWKEGFDVGWEPQTKDTPIVFGSGGRAVGVQ
ncbi:hypothetical protein HC931_00520 [Candidatus Gracilibacteria bacterium]|jgi:hypothetical protein|nr:hypothetical protein [Candidatus Gracilibacteria bacterium]NJM85940.1 hypothetical protein [Hydrococcus sp. RU_2_2]NJP17595.1 hypothetical protein [Hydrococcus sp. CRU_1_1]